MNPITFLILIVFLLPLIAGALKAFSKKRVFSFVGSMFCYAEFLFALIFSVYISRKIFITRAGGFFGYLYNIVPEKIKSIFDGKDILVYLFIVPFLLSVFMIIIRIVSIPFYRTLGFNISEGIYNALNKMNNTLKRLIGAIANIPNAIISVFLLVILLHLYTYYQPSPNLAGWMNQSKAYSFMYKNTVSPLINSKIAKEIPVLLNESFAKGTEGNHGLADIPEQLYDKLHGNVRVIEYFNGVTIDKAVKSNDKIDETARKIVSKAKTDKDKAYKIYKWISSNIEYDYDKAIRLSKDPTGISSGSVVAFESRKGICFDYSSLYVSMCQAVGLKAQLVTGLGYSGVSWGDHAWNRVFSSEENRWINVDATFGTMGNYFDKANFGVDHMDAEVQWP